MAYLLSGTDALQRHIDTFIDNIDGGIDASKRKDYTARYHKLNNFAEHKLQGLGFGAQWLGRPVVDPDLLQQADCIGDLNLFKESTNHDRVEAIWYDLVYGRQIRNNPSIADRRELIDIIEQRGLIALDFELSLQDASLFFMLVDNLMIRALMLNQQGLWADPEKYDRLLNFEGLRILTEFARLRRLSQVRRTQRFMGTVVEMQGSQEVEVENGRRVAEEETRESNEEARGLVRYSSD